MTWLACLSSWKHSDQEETFYSHGVTGDLQCNDSDEQISCKKVGWGKKIITPQEMTGRNSHLLGLFLIYPPTQWVYTVWFHNPKSNLWIARNVMNIEQGCQMRDCQVWAMLSEPFKYLSIPGCYSGHYPKSGRMEQSACCPLWLWK